MLLASAFRKLGSSRNFAGPATVPEMRGPFSVAPETTYEGAGSCRSPLPLPTSVNFLMLHLLQIGAVQQTFELGELL